MRVVLAVLSLCLTASWSVAQTEPAAPRPAATSLSDPKGATQPVDARGFIHRWLVLEPVPVPGRLTESAVQEALQLAVLPDIAGALPNHGEAITVNGGEHKWHALDTLNYNLNLYHFAWALSKPTSNVLFWVTTAVDSPREMTGVRLAIGSNAASRWWLNSEPVIALNDDRQSVIDDGVSGGSLYARAATLSAPPSSTAAEPRISARASWMRTTDPSRDSPWRCSSRLPMPGPPSRKQLVPKLRKYTPRTMDRTVAYNSRCDDNPVNAISWVSFLSVGSTRQLDAIANALEAKPNWETDIGNSLSYLMFADRLSFFWHRQFRFVFADHPQPLRMMDWESMTLTMGLAFAIGWRELAEFQGCLTTATLNRAYHLANGQDERHRRGHAFMCRLFASWRRDGTGHRFPAWAHGVPAYEQLLDRWRSADTPELERLLLSACDHHLEQGTLDTEKRLLRFR